MKKLLLLNRFFQQKKDFGNDSVSIYVVPMEVKDWLPIDVYRKAFEGNPAFSYATSVEGIYSNPIHYIVFSKEVVQFYNDSLSDVNGLCSTLYQDIAKEVFEGKKGVNFCTDIE